jgi:hypothetical protein
MFSQASTTSLQDGSSADSTNLSIQDPNSQDPNAKLQGQAAFQKIVAQSSLGKGGLSYGVANYLGQAAGLGEDNTESGSDGEHRDTGESDSVDVTDPGLSEYRLITLKEDLALDEQAVFDTRIELLKATNVETTKRYTRVLKEARNFDKDKWPKTIVSRGVRAQELDRSIDYATFNNKTVLPCASLIECLIYINSKIKIRGEFDLNRGWIYTAGGKGGNLNDHVCGRGIDIFEVGESEDSMINLRSKDVDKHKQALNIILKVLETMPQNIHPDLLVVHDGLAEEYGMQRGGFDIDVKNGPTGGILQKQYQYLRNVNFHPDDGHRDHIHLAFSPWRSGNYIDWALREKLNEGSLQDAIDLIGNPNTLPGVNVPIAGPQLTELFTTFAAGTAIQNKDALYRALVQYGNFSPEVAATFMMLAERESNFQPGVFASDGDDYSIGLFQTNYADTTIPRERLTPNSSAFINRVVTVSSLNSSGVIQNKRVRLWKLLIKDWQSLKVTNAQQAWDKIREYRLRGAGRELIDPRLFQPINQINLVVSYVEAYTSRWKFTSWGEYRNGPEYGWINRTKIQTAIDYYVRNNPGKTKNNYIRWANHRIMREAMIVQKSKENYAAWLQGQVFGW